MDYIARSDIEHKAAFVRRLRKAYGRTALCLSGGASFGYYHLGAFGLAACHCKGPVCSGSCPVLRSGLGSRSPGPGKFPLTLSVLP